MSFLLYFGTVLLLGASPIRACELIPGNPGGSCLELASTAYITTANSQFGPVIEGSAVNAAGEIFAVNYGDSNTINQLGQVYPVQKLFYRDSNAQSWFNGIRFLNSETAFIADVSNHRILKLTIDPSNNNSVIGTEDYCTDPTMLQPNDLALSVTGTVYTSGMRWLADTNATHGDIWSCLPNGRAQRLEILGRTNGIELSPDEKSLYVSESYNRGGNPYIQRIWKYRANVADGSIPTKTLFVDFERLDGTQNVDIDGMKTDVNGNLFVTRHGGRQVAIFSPQGELIGKIRLTFPNPTNLEFGGPTGTTLFIVGKCEGSDKGCIDQINVVTPGRSWTNQQQPKK